MPPATMTRALQHRVGVNRTLGVHVEYADLTALMLLLDIKLGGGVMDVVNEGQKLIRHKAHQA